MTSANGDQLLDLGNYGDPVTGQPLVAYRVADGTASDRVASGWTVVPAAEVERIALLGLLPDWVGYAEWRIDLDSVLDAKGRIPLNLNDRGMHWAAKATAISRVKAATRNAVLAAEIPHLSRVHVEMHYRPKTNRFRDIDNTVATMKPIIDALHTRDTAENHPIPYEPIIDGDDPRYVTWSPPVLHAWEKGKLAALWLILRSLG